MASSSDRKLSKFLRLLEHRNQPSAAPEGVPAHRLSLNVNPLYLLSLLGPCGLPSVRLPVRSLVEALRSKSLLVRWHVLVPPKSAMGAKPSRPIASPKPSLGAKATRPVRALGASKPRSLTSVPASVKPQSGKKGPNPLSSVGALANHAAGAASAVKGKGKSWAASLSLGSACGRCHRCH